MLKLFVLFFSLIILLFPSPVLAHLAGQPPFFKMNGTYTLLYPVFTSSLPDFNLPQDLAPENYIVGQNISFEIDTTQLPIPEPIIQQSKFEWDFGDGTKATGLKNTHSYNKMGSYNMTIYVLSPDTTIPQLLQSTLINVLPDRNYKLPRAVLKTNGQISKDPLTDILKVRFKEDVVYDATLSTSNAPLTGYQWDFGDGSEGNGPTSTHKYDAQLNQYFPVLRIKNADGFISDTFVEIENDDNAPQAPAAPQTSSKFPWVTLGFVLLGVLGGIGFLTSRKK